MHNKPSNILFICAALLLIAPVAWAVCPPPAIPTNCASVANCSTPKNDTDAFKDVDKGFVKKVKKVHKKVMETIDWMDEYVSKSIATHSSVKTHLTEDYIANITKAMEVVEKKRQQFQQDENTLTALQIAKPGKNFVQAGVLKSQWPETESMTRAIRQQLYDDHVRRLELEGDQYYSDQSNPQEQKYASGSIAGYAKLYATHKDFFCNAAGANKPPGCGEKADSNNEDPSRVIMGDQMLDIYLGDRTWPKNQVSKAIELMQFYLGMRPPEMPNPSKLYGSDGQREYITYQGKLAKSNFLTYILSYLVAKRAPTNEGQAQFIKIRKEASGCDNITDDNRGVCDYLDGVLAYSPQASRSELSKALEFNRFMNPAYVTKSISGTLGIEKDLTLMMVDRLQQDYEEYQMDKMITAAMAGYYANMNQ